MAFLPGLRGSVSPVRTSQHFLQWALRVPGEDRGRLTAFQHRLPFLVAPHRGVGVGGTGSDHQLPSLLTQPGATFYGNLTSLFWCFSGRRLFHVLVNQIFQRQEMPQQRMARWREALALPEAPPLRSGNSLPSVPFRAEPPPGRPRIP